MNGVASCVQHIEHELPVLTLSGHQKSIILHAESYDHKHKRKIFSVEKVSSIRSFSIRTHSNSSSTNNVRTVAPVINLTNGEHIIQAFATL